MVEVKVVVGDEVQARAKDVGTVGVSEVDWV